MGGIPQKIITLECFVNTLVQFRLLKQDRVRNIHGMKYIHEIYGSLAEYNIQITTELYYGDVPSIAKTTAHLH